MSVLDHTEVAVIGGGIVGLATAYQLSQSRPGIKIVVLEKESDIALHQTGRNSGVIHSGIYYRPGSFKAAFCRQGKLWLEEFCRRESIPFESCGKLIVALDAAEEKRLQDLFQRGQENQVRCELWQREQIRAREPHVAGNLAIYVPETGIVDYRRVAHRLADLVRDAGGQIHVSAKVISAHMNSDGINLNTTRGAIHAQRVINCAGLFSDRIYQLTGGRPEQKIIPFRGEYFELKPSAQHLCRHLIYPVPDPQLPFLGVHFTRMQRGGVECGPNAVPALKREGYTWGEISIRDVLDSATYPGAWKMGWKWWKTGVAEIWRSLSKKAFVRALQRLIPEIRAEDLEPAPAGVRAQAVNRQGGLVDDFVIIPDGRALHVLNAPSPAATASLAIGKAIVETYLAQKE